MSINLKKTVGILGVSALLAVPVAMSSANVNASANANPYASTINWNNKYGDAENSVDHQPAVENPSGIHITKGTPSAQYGSQFEFTVPGSNDIYAASWRSPLAHELLAGQKRNGVKPVQARRVLNNVPKYSLHKAVVPQKQGAVMPANVNGKKNANVNVNRGKLAQTNEAQGFQGAGIIAGIGAMASIALAGASKLLKKA